MNGKVVKVKQYNIEFGAKDRFVNLIGCFKYTSNGNIYIVYSDVESKYSIIYYGSGHVKGNSTLCMKCRSKEEVEIIKAYLFKLVGNEEMNEYQEIQLDEVEELEIIDSDKIDIKPEALNAVLDKKIPKKEEEAVEPTVATSKKKTKKKSGFPKTLLLILLMVIVGGGVYFMLPKPEDNTITSSITCERTYNHDELEAEVTEINKFNFNMNENLEYVDTTKSYQFDQEEYDEFILKGTYYKYIPDDDTLVDTKNDQDNYKFTVITKVNVNETYQLPTKYEEVLKYYEDEGFSCNESVVK